MSIMMDISEWNMEVKPDEVKKSRDLINHFNQSTTPVSYTHLLGHEQRPYKTVFICILSMLNFVYFVLAM